MYAFLTSVGSLVSLTVTGAVTLSGTNTSSGLLKVTNTTASSAYNNGALTVAGGVGVGGNLYVGGEIVAQKIYSKGRVDAGTGVSAGPLGFVTGTGGISVGVPTPATPVAVPGQIMCIGNILSYTSINAMIAMNAPLGNFGTMSAVLMTDLINTGIYDSHIHPTPKGMSGPPTLPMI